MNPNEMQTAWNSPRNNLTSEQQRQLAGQFSRQMIRRRRFQAAWLVWTFIALTAGTLLATRAIHAGNAKLNEEWELFPLLIVPWAFAFYFLRRHLKPAGSEARGEMPVVDSVLASLASNRAERSHLRMVGILYAVMIPLLALAMRQLGAAGKASSSELASMAVLFGGVLLLSGAGIAARYFTRLLPQQKRLEALLAELTSEAQ